MVEIGSEFSLCLEKDFFFRRMKSFGKRVSFLRCGRDSIGLIADMLTRNSGTVFFPAYCCESMTSPFIIRGWNIEYFPINDDFSADIHYIISHIEKFHPDAILLMNYFGISDTSMPIQTIKAFYPNIQIIEDITHSLFDIEKIYSENVDFYVASIRKWIGIPDGAMIISTNDEIPLIKHLNSDFVDLRKEGLTLKEEYLHSKKTSLKTRFRDCFNRAESSLEHGKIPYSISPISQQILHNYNIKQLTNYRKWNADLLLRNLKAIQRVHLPANIDKILEMTPFSIPIFLAERDIVQKQLAENGVYAALLWPLNKKAREISPFAAHVENTILSIPIDQRYDANDMDQIFTLIKKVKN